MCCNRRNRTTGGHIVLITRGTNGKWLCWTEQKQDSIRGEGNSPFGSCFVLCSRFILWLFSCFLCFASGMQLLTESSKRPQS